MATDLREQPGPSEHAPPTRPLRFGIMCEGLAFTAWQAACVDDLLETGMATPALLILDGVPAAKPRTTLKRVVGAVGNSRFLWNQYRRLVVMKRSAAYKARDMSAALAGLPSITCEVERKGKFSEYFRESDIADIRGYDLDFVLRFAFGIIRGEILDVPRFGVWSYHHGDLEKYRGVPPGFWEIHHRDPVSAVTLQRLTDRLDGGVVLHRGWFRTIEKSYVRNLDNIMTASTYFPARVVRDIVAGAGGYVDAPASPTAAPIFHAPNNAQMLRFLAQTTTSRVKDTWQWLFRHAQWNVGVIEKPIHAFLDPQFKPVIRWLDVPPGDRFLADPFAIARDGGLTLLVEQYDYRTAKGHIATARWRGGRTTGPFSKMMETPVHLSYPYAFEHGGDVYCVPEMSQAKRVELHRAVEFPNRWERVATLVEDFAAVDATVFRHDGLWWLFCARVHQNEWIKLHAFYAGSLTGPWRPHSGNPLKADVRSSRPAGTPFVHEGVLYRPAQDCSRTYGGAVAINRVVRLSPTKFEETVHRIVSLGADEPYSAGCHTLSAAGDRTVIDGKRLIFKPSEFAREAAKLVRRGLRS
jgi:hypothetical protein